MRLLMFCCFAIFSQLISFSLYAAEPIWIKDSTNGCLIFNPSPQPNETVTWSGNCVGGKADGVGEIVWYVDGILAETEKMTGENGLTMVAGKYTYNVTSDVRFDLKECNTKVGYSIVNAFVKKDFALWHQNELAVPILNMAKDFAKTRCQIKGLSEGPEIYVYYEGEENKENYKIKAQRSRNNWANAENIAWKNFYVPQKQNYATLLAKRKADTQMRDRIARETREREQAENARRIVQDRYNAFAKKNSVTNYIKSDALEANPFVYEGKIIAVELNFSEMLTADRGLFRGVVVSGLPGNLFTVQNTKVVLAGKVLGKTPLKTPLGGEVSVPHLRFVGVHICANFMCSDLVQ